jgi:DNA-binding GntR family transcriptional regulator
MLRARDASGAEAAMRRHIEEPGEWIRRAMAGKSSADSSRDLDQEIGPNAI